MFTKRSTIKSLASIVTGVELISLGKTMKEVANNVEINPVEEEAFEYEFVFYEKAIHAMKKTIVSLLESAIINGVEVEQEVIDEARKLLNMFEWLLEKKRVEEENGNKA
jgi:hypothetical protein